MKSSKPRTGVEAVSVSFTKNAFSVDLADGRTITVPLTWFPRLLHASKVQRENWKISAGGYGIHWPDVDEDLSTDGLLHGSPAPRSEVTSRPTP